MDVLGRATGSPGMAERDVTLDELEYHTWPSVHRGGQHVGTSTGVLVIHVRTGLGALCTSERSQFKNRVIAVRLVQQMVHDYENPVVTIKALQ